MRLDGPAAFEGQQEPEKGGEARRQRHHPTPAELLTKKHSHRNERHTPNLAEHTPNSIPP